VMATPSWKWMGYITSFGRNDDSSGSKSNTNNKYEPDIGNRYMNGTSAVVPAEAGIQHWYRFCGSV